VPFSEILASDLASAQASSASAAAAAGLPPAKQSYDDLFEIGGGGGSGGGLSTFGAKAQRLCEHGQRIQLDRSVAIR
jgi:hypothetical protein